ncbi:hypothetical protein ABZU53_02045 [Micromonospora sp. NPDC005194]|uniref:hypothetical protein n=1 Tax=Micromonospora sp. NPDC005194 TaxID=3156870 RepID=UPI0033AC49C7
MIETTLDIIDQSATVGEIIVHTEEVGGCTAIRTAKPADIPDRRPTTVDKASRSAAVTDGSRQQA